MTKRNIIITLAVIIALMPFLGFPRSFEDICTMIAGIFIIVLLVDFKKFRRRNSRNSRSRKKSEADTYVENQPPRSIQSNVQPQDKTDKSLNE